jgi:hypothetical protein
MQVFDAGTLAPGVLARPVSRLAPCPSSRKEYRYRRSRSLLSRAPRA